MMARALFVARGALLAAGRIVPDAEAALRDSHYASSPSGTRGVWLFGFADGWAAKDDSARISKLWMTPYRDGLEAGAAARGQRSDPVTDMETP